MEDPARVLKPIKALRASMGSSAAAKRTLAEIGISGVSKEVANMDTDQVTAEIEAICMSAIASVLRGDGFRYIMPARTASNQLYVAELDRVVLRDKVMERVFASSSLFPTRFSF